MIFTKEKIAVHSKLSAELLTDSELNTSHDIVKNLITTILEAHILSRLNEKQSITVTAKRPTFMDWLLRRKRSFTFSFSSKEVLKNPPKLKEGFSVIMYGIEERTDEGEVQTFINVYNYIFCEDVDTLGQINVHALSGHELFDLCLRFCIALKNS